MPIKAENIARYPKDWKQIRERILERAGNCCEGSPDFQDCRIANGSIGYRDGGRWIQLGATADEAGLSIDAAIEDGHRVITIVLTIGHLDHTPENCADENLRAWCQRCHLNYDAKHHAQNSYATRREGRVVGDLFEKHS